MSYMLLPRPCGCCCNDHCFLLPSLHVCFPCLICARFLLPALAHARWRPLFVEYTCFHSIESLRVLSKLVAPACAACELRFALARVLCAWACACCRGTFTNDQTCCAYNQYTRAHDSLRAGAVCMLFTPQKSLAVRHTQTWPLPLAASLLLSATARFGTHMPRYVLNVMVFTSNAGFGGAPSQLARCPTYKFSSLCRPGP
jgi:hypothetical protein